MTPYKKTTQAQILRTVPVLLLFVLILSGCASSGRVNLEKSGDAGDQGKAGIARPDNVSDLSKARLVQPGDLVDLRFLCRLQTGEVVAATDRSVGQRTDVTKSAIFLMRDKDGPVSVTADVLLPMTEQPTGTELPFEEEIVKRLAGAVTGMKEGESRTVNLTAQQVPERRAEDYVIKIPRVRVRVKEMRMSLDEYRSRIGRSPEAGQPVIFDPAVPGRVETVTPDEVVIRFFAQPGTVAPTPFGPGQIRETEKAYEIVVNARRGALVRSGPLVGRITDVNETSITLDYRNPFGNEILVCDVAVDKVADAKTDKSGTGE
jgi:FKBP-type peptidyl-prolyl cis-trans isomerase 2